MLSPARELSRTGSPTLTHVGTAAAGGGRVRRGLARIFAWRAYAREPPTRTQLIHRTRMSDILMCMRAARVRMQLGYACSFFIRVVRSTREASFSRILTAGARGLDWGDANSNPEYSLVETYLGARLSPQRERRGRGAEAEPEVSSVVHAIHSRMRLFFLTHRSALEGIWPVETPRGRFRTSPSP